MFTLHLFYFLTNTQTLHSSHQVIKDLQQNKTSTVSQSKEDFLDIFKIPFASQVRELVASQFCTFEGVAIFAQHQSIARFGIYLCRNSLTTQGLEHNYWCQLFNITNKRNISNTSATHLNVIVIDMHPSMPASTAHFKISIKYVHLTMGVLNYVWATRQNFRILTSVR